MKQWRFEVFNRAETVDVHGNSVLEDIRELGVNCVEAVQSAKVFLIEGDFDDDFARRLGDELLADRVCAEYYIGRSSAPAGLAKATLIEVHLKSGVTDPVAQSGQDQKAVLDGGSCRSGIHNVNRGWSKGIPNIE